MIIRKLFHRPTSAPPQAGKVAVAPPPNTATPLEPGLKERRSFPRPLPVPEVQEQDWSTWVNITQGQKPPPSD